MKSVSMKKALKVFASLVLVFFTAISLSSCRNDDDPTDNDYFAGTYKGHISYSSDATTIDKDNGSVFVTKVASGTKYNFAFSDNIPDINGVEFKQEGDHVLVMLGTNESAYIRIDNNTLKILYSKDGKSWAANCTR